MLRMEGFEGSLLEKSKNKKCFGGVGSCIWGLTAFVNGGQYVKIFLECKSRRARAGISVLDERVGVRNVSIEHFLIFFQSYRLGLCRSR